MVFAVLLLLAVAVAARYAEEAFSANTILRLLPRLRGARV